MIVRKYSKKVEIYGHEAKATIYNRPKYVHISNRTDYSINHQNEKRDDSLSRTRTKIYQLVNCNHYAHGKYPAIFLTLTFAKNITNVKQANIEFNLFIQRLSYHTNQKLKYLAVIEFQKRGAVHYHMVCNLVYVRNKILSKIWKHGFLNIKKLRTDCNIGLYMMKYLGKEANILQHKKKYWTSKNLNRPIEIIDNEEIINYLTDSNINIIYTNDYYSEKGGWCRFKELEWKGLRDSV